MCMGLPTNERYILEGPEYNLFLILIPNMMLCTYGTHKCLQMAVVTD